MANALAILEANEHTIYDPPAVFDSNKSEILLSTENKLKEIYEAFPNEGKVCAWLFVSGFVELCYLA